MKKFEKQAALVLSLALIGLQAAGCGSTDSGTKTESVSTDTSAAAEETTAASAETAASASSEETAAGSSALVEETVLYDQDGIRITANGLEDGLFGSELKLLIENNMDKPVVVQAEDSSVNGYMVTTQMSADVDAGKKANDSLTFETSGLKECGIETIATMEFRFTILNPDNYDTIAESDVITLNTSAAENFTQTYDDSGTVLVDQGGVKIVNKGLSRDGSFFGPGVIFYIENNTDQKITVQADNVSVNGFMVSSMMSEDLVPGKKAISALQFFSSDLEQNGITDVTNTEFKFHVFNSESWDTIFDSDQISLDF